MIAYRILRVVWFTNTRFQTGSDGACLNGIQSIFDVKTIYPAKRKRNIATVRMGNEEDPRDIRYMSEAEMIIQAARTGFDGKGKPLNDREIIRHLTSSCFSDDDLYDQARKFAPAMGWDIEEFVEQTRRIGRYG